MKLTNLFGRKNKQDINLNDREIWVNTLDKIIYPVLKNASNETLKENMPIEYVLKEREKFSHLEAVGRTICGISPWLELGSDNTTEGKLREKYIELSLKTLKNISNPESKDYLVYEVESNESGQPLVDCAFLAEGLLRGKKQLWNNLNNKTQEQIINVLKKTRTIEPSENNWVLFPTMIESFLLEVTGDCNLKKLKDGIHFFRDKWYCGDSVYGDGPSFHIDYYNSYVIHPMMTDSLVVMKKHDLIDSKFYNIQLSRLSHFSNSLERMISPEGTYPLLGRSMLYRNAVFHALGQSALMHNLPENIHPAQVRCGLTAVIKNQFKNNSNFDKNGWLQFGFNGKQHDIAEWYSNTGSMYLCTTGFLPLGLSPEDSFWSNPYEEWTSLKAWTGKHIDSTSYLTY